MASARSLWMRSRAVSVEWFGRYADWNGDTDGNDCR
jgi:hypothetical protein